MSSLPVAILLGDRLGSMHAALSPVPMARELAGCQRLRVPSKYLGCQMSQPFAMSIKLASPLFPGLSALACTCFDRVVPRTNRTVIFVWLGGCLAQHHRHQLPIHSFGEHCLSHPMFLRSTLSRSLSC